MCINSIDKYAQCAYNVIVTKEQQERRNGMENNTMTNDQFRGIIKMIIALIRRDTPKEELIEYLTELIK